LDKQLLRIVNRIRNKTLRARVLKLLENPTIKIGGKTFSGLPIEKSPASIRHHHNYAGGFIEHTVALCELCMSFSRIVSKVYECKVNNDLILCGVLLHDIYKTATYVEKGERYVMSDLAERVDHLTLASAELIRRGFPLDVVHIVVASHGREYRPMGPMTVEALICHLADYSEAKLNGDVLSAARFMIREITGEEPQVITGKEAFAIVSAKTEKGWNGVQDYLSKKRT